MTAFASPPEPHPLPATSGALPPPETLVLPPAFATRLDSLAAIGFDGPDAAAFLHGQLSTDVTAMAPGAVSLSSYNSAKGRVLATLLLKRRGPESFVALVGADLAAALRKRLSMFVLRAKVTVSDASAGKSLVGIGGEGSADGSVRALDAARTGAASTAGADVIVFPDGRSVAIVAEGQFDGLLAGAGLPDAGPAAFERLGIRAGIPVVTAATQDRFVPQALNLDLVDGVHFRKGCYPGQEIVARMQYLGRLKERLFAFRADAAAPEAGTALFGAASDDPALGTVVNSVTTEGGSEFLAVAQYDAVVSGGLRLGSSAGAVLSVLPLPYAIPVPTAPQRVKL